MAPFATQEWIDEVALRVASLPVDRELSITVAQRVEGPAEIAWTVSIHEGQVTMAQGHNPGADLVLSSDRATAEAIYAGRLSAQRAFLAGELRIGGDVAQLIANRGAFDTVAALLTGVT